eukprot:40119_1
MGTNPHFSQSGCSDRSTAREIVYNKLFACPGTFEGGISNAESLCNTAAGYHICETQNEAKSLGLTAHMCKYTVAKDKEFFAAKHNKTSTCGGGNQHGFYGCAGENGHLSDQGDCEPFLMAMYPDNSVPQNWYYTYNNLDDLALLDDSGGGVLCCNGSQYLQETGCSDIFKAREIVENKIFACSGSFEGFLYDNGAQSLCNETGYHICESIEEVETLGLTRDLCENVADTIYEFFATLTDQKRDYCTGKDLQGCSRDGSPVANNGGIFNSFLEGSDFNGWAGANMDGNTYICNYSLTNSYSGGVLCCNGSAWNYTLPKEGIFGCSDVATLSREVITNKLYACSGSFDGGLFSDGESLCNETNGYHICQSSEETQSLGLTRNLCQNVAVNDDEFFATLDQQITFCSTDNVRGCSMGNYPFNHRDGTLNSYIGMGHTFNGWEFNGCSYSLSDTSSGGVLCCKGSSTQSQSISGCSNITTSREIVSNQIFACPGTFSGGIYSESAESLCNRNVGYHICESSQEAQTLGFTRDLCEFNVGSHTEFFATQHNHTECVQQFNDEAIFGCVGSDVAICNEFNFRLEGSDWNDWHSNNGQIDGYQLINEASGGVLCCNASYLLPNTTWNPTINPTLYPTNPSVNPTMKPTSNPTISFTLEPSANPTFFLEGIGCLNAMTEREIVPNQLYACPGVFGGKRGLGNGGNGAYAEMLCNDNYHICEDSMETEIMGLTLEICINDVVINDVEFFATNNLCGCSSNTTKAMGCGVLNSKLEDEGADWNNWVWNNDTSTYILNDSASGGVLCCIDSIGLTINFGYDTCSASYEFSATQSRIFKNKKGVYIDIGSQLTTVESVTAISDLIETVPLLFNMKDIFSTFSFTITNIVAGIYIIIGIKWYEQDPDSTKPQNIEINMIAFLVAILQIMLIVSFPMYTSFSSCLMDDLSFDLNVNIIGFSFALLSFIFIIMWLVYICKNQTQCGLCPNQKCNRCWCLFWWLLFTNVFIATIIIIPNPNDPWPFTPYFIGFFIYSILIWYGWFIVWCKQCNYCESCSCSCYGDPLECCGCPCRCCCKFCECFACKCCPCCGQKCHGMKCYKCYRFPLLLPFFLAALLPFFLTIVGDDKCNNGYDNDSNRDNDSNNNYCNDGDDDTNSIMGNDGFEGHEVFWIFVGPIIGTILLVTFFRTCCNKRLFPHWIFWNLVVHPTYILYIIMNFTVPLIWMNIITPFWITITFFQIKELRVFTEDIITIYLVTLDVITDINLIFYWSVITENYAWALIQALFIFIGQLLSLSKEPTTKNKKEEKSIRITLTKLDKCMPFIGLGRPWYLIKAWSNTSTKEYYQTLNQRIKVWEIMMESFPSVSLQIYVSMVQDEYSSSLIQSILASFISLTWTVWVFLLMQSQKEIKVKDTGNSSPKIDNNGAVDLVLSDGTKIESNTTIDKEENISKPTKWGYVKKKKIFYIHLYLFMISDFFLRTYPLISLTALTRNGLIEQNYNIWLRDSAEIIAFCVLMIMIVPLLLF